MWMVYIEGSKHSPKHQHNSVESAREEAERLVRMTGRRVLLLEHIATCSTDFPSAPPVKWQLSDKAIIAVSAP